ncbi:hypothetical protein CO2235_230295 [Cupriavidus oxalaticus]|uniref:Uncharacterized protein n=1 Tax=Cupriavidus oxalaticus TaxID=96344 RepID=A0A375G8M2_9BURK|nr:hypothetical protein CO2235_230295 [Cupriavidus oxalaticus]
MAGCGSPCVTARWSRLATFFAHSGKPLLYGGPDETAARLTGIGCDTGLPPSSSGPPPSPHIVRQAFIQRSEVLCRETRYPQRHG